MYEQSYVGVSFVDFENDKKLIYLVMKIYKLIIDAKHIYLIISTFATK